VKQVIALIFAVLATTATASQPLFSSATDDKTIESNWSVPSPRITRAIQASMDADQKELVSDYLSENKKIRGVRNLLSATKIQLCATCSDVFFFVRPSSSQYSPLYGAHSYTFWLVRQDGKVVHSASVDKLDILDENNVSMRPFEQSICLTSKCYITRFEFREREYLPISCRTHYLADDLTENNCD